MVTVAKKMAQDLLAVNLYGACYVRLQGGADIEIKSAKHRAMIALLITAFEGRRSRKFLQETLWASARHDGGSQSLRRALSDLRKLLGASFDTLFNISNSDIQIRLESVVQLGDNDAGEFLEGLDIKEPPFQTWLDRYKRRLSRGGESEFGRDIDPVAIHDIRVAVIPFRHVFGGIKLSILGNVLAEDISRGFSHSRLVGVISPLYTRQIVDQEEFLDVLQGNLQAEYVIGGSIRSEDGIIQLDVDFTDIACGQMLWSRRFEWSEGQGSSCVRQIVSEICRATARTIATETIDAISRQPLGSIADQRLVIGAVSLMHGQSLSGFLRAKAMLDEAIERNRNPCEMHAWMAKWHVLRVVNGWTVNVQEDCRLALEFSDRALEIQPENAFALTVNGMVHHYLFANLDKAERCYKMALAIDLNESLARLLMGAVLANSGDTRQAVIEVERACSQLPFEPIGYFYDSVRAAVYLADGDAVKALEFAECSIDQNPRISSTLSVKIAALHALERYDEARQVARELLVHAPVFSVGSFVKNHPGGDSDIANMTAHALIAAGLPK